MDDLIKAVFLFAKEMLCKLNNKYEEGWDGWDDKKQCDTAEFIERLKDHVDSRDWVDVANFAMFLWWRKRRR